jgi:hypothetical protein
MKKRYFAIIFLSLISKSSLSQQFVIIDSSGQVIPYATVEVVKRNIAVFADKNGAVILLSYDLTVKDTITISAIGYENLKIAKKDITGKLVMVRNFKPLPPVIVFNGKWTKENWGSVKKPSFLFGGYPCRWHLFGPGDQIGRIIMMPADHKGPAWIYRIAFFTENDKDIPTPVRLRIYTINEKGLPGADILTKSMVTTLRKNKNWLEFDLSETPVEIRGGGLIVAAEYFDTDKINWYKEKVAYTDSSGIKRKEEWTGYGGSFATDGETIQGPTLMRFRGSWFQMSKLDKMKECENLVVQVWVKYPGK